MADDSIHILLSFFIEFIIQIVMYTKDIKSFIKYAITYEKNNLKVNKYKLDSILFLLIILYLIITMA